MAGANTFGQRRSYHHDLNTASGASDTLTADSSEGRRICSHARTLGEDARKLGADEDLMRAEEDDGAVRRQGPAAETASVVLDEAEVAKLLREAADDTLTGRKRSRPDRNPSQRR